MADLTRDDATRATTPVVAVALLVALTVLAASTVAVGALALGTPDVGRPVALSLSATAADDRLAVTHRGGPALNVSRLTLVVAVDGDELARQPPVPFFAAAGFHGGPTGPFNSGAEPDWRAGETGTFQIAETNEPTVTAGASVTVTVSRGDHRLAHVQTRAE